MKLRYIFLLPVLFICMQIFGQDRSDFGIYKDWGTTETRVIGMVKLKDTIGREFDRIVRVDSNTIRIDEYNPVHTFINSTIVRFVNKHISAIEYANKWGLVYNTVRYTLDSNHIYTVTEVRDGVNDLLPCKEAKYIYKNDLLVEIRYVSFGGKPCNDYNGVACIKFVPYEDPDRYGRRREKSFFDEDGQPTFSRALDYHKVVYDRDKHGNILSEQYYDEEGHKLQSRNGTFITKSVYDSSDNEIAAYYCGANGEVKNNIYGVGHTGFDYDFGLEMAYTLYDDHNNVIKASDTGIGIAITRYEYNTDGYTTSRSYFDENQNPMNDQNGIHRYLYTYDYRDMLIEEKYTDKNGAPAVDKENIHRYIYERDNYGRKLSIAFFDIDNRPVKNKIEEVYMLKYKYNANDLLESESYWEGPNKKMRSWSGSHKIVYKYNDIGQQTEVINYDEQGKTYLGKSGYSRLVQKYDANARICGYSWYDDTIPTHIVHSALKNYHSIKLTYDLKNRITQIEYFDENEKPTNAFIELGDKFECNKIELKYVANRLTEEYFYPLKSSFPTKMIDCLKHDYVDPQGINFGRKNRQ